MGNLNWDVFESLQGDVTNNWESLCRELVRRNYARFGKFKSISQQPGIEFQLHIDRDCSLGISGRHFGWQCRWYGLGAGKQIGKNRRSKVESAIRTTEKYSPEISDWVLWTRRSLTPTDKKWFEGISTKLTLHNWYEEEIEGCLYEAPILREAFFGELALSKEKIHCMHEVVMAPLRRRWEPQLAVEVDVERHLKAHLAARGSWSELDQVSANLAKTASQLASKSNGLRPTEIDLIKGLSETMTRQSEHLSSVAAELRDGNVAKAKAIVKNSVVPTVKKRAFDQLGVNLRSINHPTSLLVGSIAGEVSDYFVVLRRLNEALTKTFFPVIGDAGFGKTFLSAQLTEPTQDSPGGILLLAKWLSKGGTLDELAKRVPFGGDRMTQLLEAANAFGTRMGRRIPIVIDGLNESENPADWQDLLATLKVQLRDFDHCVIVVTLRNSVANAILDENEPREFLAGFQYDREEALKTYFSYYKINADGAILPQELDFPLFLSLYCQATNPDRLEVVGVERIPGSLTEVFERFRQIVVSRAAATLGLRNEDIQAALARVGLALWDEGERSFGFDRLRTLVGDEPRDWARSLARVLEEEGVLSREPFPAFNGPLYDEDAPSNQVSAILYDAFAGFIIADALLERFGAEGMKTWIDKNWRSLDWDDDDVHPFADDVFRSLVGLLPRKTGTHLWKHVPPKLKPFALLEAAYLEPKWLDDQTKDELLAVSKDSPAVRGRSIYARLWETRSSVSHPLNSRFLNEMLKDLNTANRDLTWTEWLRQTNANYNGILNDLERLRLRWRRTAERSEEDSLLCMWTSWVLTSTDRHLRDKATEAIFWYGLGCPLGCFEMALEALDLNDPYVPERLFAASYGVVMGRQRFLMELKQPLSWLLTAFREKLSCDAAPTNTQHWMIRIYVQGIVDFCHCFLQSIIPDGLLDTNGLIRFAVFQPKTTRKHREFYLGRDFENYVVGRLFSDRRGYDNKHIGFKKAIAEIRQRIWELGYRPKVFQRLDEQLSNDFHGRRSKGRIERYAKKYGWIAYYEKAGRMSDDGTLARELRSGRGNPIVDIDPSFPRIPQRCPIELPDWTEDISDDDPFWLEHHSIVVPNEFLRAQELCGHNGPWIAVDGFIEMANKRRRRTVFGFIRGLIVDRSKADRLFKDLNKAFYLGNDYIPDEPTDYYTFAGEIPWSSEFGRENDTEKDYGPYEFAVGEHGSENPIVEILSHRFGWESGRSLLNEAEGYSVPSKVFSQQFSLKSGTATLDQFDSQGNLASMSLGPPICCQEDGSVLYIREDLLREYLDLNEAAFIVVAWGERNIKMVDYEYPDWAQSLFSSRKHLWRRIATLNDLDSDQLNIPR